MRTDTIQSKANGKHVAKESTPCFELKGSVITMIEMRLLQSNLDFFSIQLDKKVRQAADFFLRAPIVLDLEEVQSADNEIDFLTIAETIRANNLVLVGFRNGNQQQLKQAKILGFNILPDTSDRVSSEIDLPANTAKTQEQEQSQSQKPEYMPPSRVASYSRTVYQPVRSGQQIYAKGCDLVILNSVSAGAEIIADGHIHVYGKLRGRALAGVHGDKSARIFCSNLEAELISIAGYYRVIEEIEDRVKNQAVQIYLKDERVTIEKF